MMRETSPMGLRDFVHYDYHMAMVFDSTCMKCFDHTHSFAYPISYCLAIFGLLFGVVYSCFQLSPDDPLLSLIIIAGFIFVIPVVILGSYIEYRTAWFAHHSKESMKNA